MNLSIDSYPLNTLCELTNIVCDNEYEFIKRFCHQSTMDVTNISFGTEVVAITYVLDSGQHIADTIDLEEFFQFVSAVQQ